VAQAASGPPRKILWVDDHQWNNSEVELIESRWPVDIDRALSTDEAMQKLQSTAYDLVIEDMDRRGNNRAGIELLEKLRDEKKDIPVVVYTSSASARRYGAEARRLGAKKVTASAVALMDAIQSIFG
jgi:CheY-like chemotaxis protein